MNRKQVIETLEMENELICFNPLTGEEIPLEFVNDLNRKCYHAHTSAIELIKNSIPIEWIDKWGRRNTCLYGSKDNVITILLREWECKQRVEQANKALEDWEAERGADK